MQSKSIFQHLKSIPCPTIRAMALLAYKKNDLFDDKVFFSAMALAKAFNWSSNGVLDDRDFWQGVHLELNLMDTAKIDSTNIEASLYEPLSFTNTNL